MTGLWHLWTSAIPAVPLEMAHVQLMWALTVGLLIVCTVALWFERDRQASWPQPLPMGDEEEMRLAA